MCRKNPKQIYKSLYYTAPAVEVARVRVSQGVFVHLLVFMPLTAQSEKGRLQVQRDFFFWNKYRTQSRHKGKRLN